MTKEQNKNKIEVLAKLHHQADEELLGFVGFVLTHESLFWDKRSINFIIAFAIDSLLLDHSFCMAVSMMAQALYGDNAQVRETFGNIGFIVPSTCSMCGPLCCYVLQRQGLQIIRFKRNQRR